MEQVNITNCTSNANEELLYSTCGAALLIFIILSFMQSRKFLCQTCCGKKPGIVVPIDMVVSTPNRLPYTLIFGAISGEILISLLTDGYSTEAVSSIAGASTSAVLVMFVQSLIYFPLFACVDAPIPIVGLILGLLYIALVFVRYNLRVVNIALACIPATVWNTQYRTQVILGVLSQFPISVCQSWVLLWFWYRTVQEIIRLCRTKKPFSVAVFECRQTTFHSRRVRSLFRRPVVIERGKFASLLVRTTNFIYHYDPYVQYPMRFLAALIVMMNSIFLLTLISAGSAIDGTLPLIDKVTDSEAGIRRLASRINQVDILEDSTLPNGTNISAIILTVYDVTEAAVYGLAVILPAGPVLAFLWNSVLIFQMVTSIHGNLRKVAKGDLSFLPPKIPSPSYRLVAALRYAGYQIGYFVWGWILMVLVVWLAGLFGLICYYLLRYTTREFLYVCLSLGIPLLWSTIIYYLQVLLVKLLFIGDTNHKHTVLKNRRLFHFFSYVIFFQNILVGLTSSLLRILYSILFGLILMFRLDRTVLMRGFERFDSGHKTFIGFLYIEHTQNNSVLNVFVQLMLQTVGKTSGTDNYTLVEDEEGGERGGVRQPQVSRKAANRWLKAYTLLQNKSIRGLTATRLAEQREKEKEEEEERKKRVIVIKKTNKSKGKDSPVIVTVDLEEGREGGEGEEGEKGVPPQAVEIEGEGEEGIALQPLETEGLSKAVEAETV